VFVVAAKLGERFRGLRLLLGDDVLPDAAVRQLLLGGDRAVGVDVVAVVDEEIGTVSVHHGVGAHAAARFVDAPALTGGVAPPYERNRPPIRRRGPEAPDDRLADERR